MTAHLIQSAREHAQYATTSHLDAHYHQEGSVTYWGDFKDTSLPERFKLACIRLEELLYALWGARPRYDLGSTDGLWYKREDPRCLWPEQLRYTSLMDCFDTTVTLNGWREYPAYGNRWEGGYPTVPKKSKSGDPDYQFHRVSHTAFVPYGSLTRTDGAELHDPRSTKYASGSPTIAGEAVTITYTPPAEYAAEITRVDLYCNVAATQQMTPSGGNYVATIAAQAQGTLVKWYVRVTWEDSSGSHYAYDPYGSFGEGSPPATPDPPEKPHYRGEHDAYTYVAFTHYNKYEHGLPEFLYWYDQQWRKNCDDYEFTPDEKVQVGLLNIMRWTLDYIGRRLYHPPDQRREACCLYMPITWLWSGSNVQGLYVSGGKTGTPAITPRFVRPGEEIAEEDQADAQSARMTWRGVPRVYDGQDYHQNQSYGNNESWMNEPEAFYAEYGYDPYYPPSDPYGFYYTLESGVQRPGLREGDVIDATHVEEIIAAVDYIVRYGAWIIGDICRMPMTPGTFLGYSCGYYYSSTDPDEYYQSSKCCASYVENSYPEIEDGSCTPHPKPTFSECHDGCPSSTCVLSHQWAGLCSPGYSEYYYFTECDQGSISSDYATSTVACTTLAASEGDVTEQLYGWSAYVCGPLQNILPPDDLHGNGFRKERTDHACPPNARTIGASMGNYLGAVDSCAEFAGEVGVDDNFGFETVTPATWYSPAKAWVQHKTCSAPFPCGYGDLDYYEGIPGWVERNNSLCTNPATYRKNPHCAAYDEWVGGAHRFTQGCQLCMPASHICNDNKTWVAVNLNVDGTDVPYGDHGDYPSSGEALLIPKLYPYTMPQPTGDDYVNSPNDCPCETTENVTQCT